MAQCFVNHQCEQQTADTAVSVHEWMNGFKLVVDDETPHERIQLVVICVNVVFKIAHEPIDFSGRSRNESSVRPDLDLASSELPRRLVGSASPPHQNAVHVQDHAIA